MLAIRFIHEPAKISVRDLFAHTWAFRGSSPYADEILNAFDRYPDEPGMWVIEQDVAIPFQLAAWMLLYTPQVAAAAVVVAVEYDLWPASTKLDKRVNSNRVRSKNATGFDYMPDNEHSFAQLYPVDAVAFGCTYIPREYAMACLPRGGTYPMLDSQFSENCRKLGMPMYAVVLHGEYRPVHLHY